MTRNYIRPERGHIIKVCRCFLIFLFSYFSLNLFHVGIIDDIIDRTSTLANSGIGLCQLIVVHLHRI